MNGLSGLLFSCRISDELLVHMESLFTPICHSYVELHTGQWAVVSDWDKFTYQTDRRGDIVKSRHDTCDVQSVSQHQSWNARNGEVR